MPMGLNIVWHAQDIGVGLMAGQSHYVLDRPAFDAPLKVLIVVAPYYKDIADGMVAGATLVAAGAARSVIRGARRLAPPLEGSDTRCPMLYHGPISAARRSPHRWESVPWLVWNRQANRRVQFQTRHPRLRSMRRCVQLRLRVAPSHGGHSARSFTARSIRW